MDKKLADLLFSDACAIDFWQKKYAPRNLKAGEKVLRVAPSPTGFLHIGTFFSAFAQWLEVQKCGGVFYVRLEDTDQKREVAGAGDVILEVLNHFGVVPNESYGRQGGNYAPYVQSERLEIYRSFARHLIERGNAFACFCERTESKADVQQKREQALNQSGEIAEKDACRSLSFEEVEKNITAGKKFAIRLKSAGSGERVLKFNDYFKGEREIRENAKDIVLLKSDGMPTYALAHLADDILMGTTMIVRGEEWWPSLAAHLELFLAAGFKPLKYGHTPLLCINDDETGNKRKLSKRKDPQADMRFYIEQGYPKTAVIEYMLTLADSKFEDWRRANPREDLMKYNFKLSRLGSNNPMFDLNKLNDISKTVISRLSADEVFTAVSEWACKYNRDFAIYMEKNKARVLGALSIDRGGEKPRKDIIKFADVPDLYDYIFGNIKSYDACVRDLQFLENYLRSMQPHNTQQEWFAHVKNLVGANAGKQEITNAVTCLRVALTGRKNSPDLFEICKILGDDEVTARLKRAIELWKK